jgi:uncharacterized protein YndB with AHSA1/START domain
VADAQTLVVVTQVMAVAPEAVFDAWLDASHAGAWLFATPTGRIVEVAIDPVVGGAFRITDRRDGEDVLHVGTFLELERPARLVFEFGVPKYSEARDRVVVTMAPAGAECEVTLTHALTPGMEEWAESVREGWTGILAGLARELARAAGPALPAEVRWIGEFSGAVTVCDARGVILGMNDKSAATFEADGGRRLIGSNLLDCHPEPSRSLVADLLARPHVNAYTIEKRGVRKLIYQAPWFDGGVFSGLVELSLEIPADMPHFVRQG